MPFIDFDLYPQWLTATFSVSYDANGALSGTVPTDPIIYDYGSIVVVQDNPGDLIKSRYVFVGWNTAPDGSGVGYIKDDGFLITSDVVLYAQWRSAHGRGYVSKFFVTAESINGTDKDKPYQLKTWRQPTISG